MISWKMIRTLKIIQHQQEQHGACKANQIDTYRDRSTKYRSLQRLEKLELIKTHKAPNSHRIQKTYTITDLGRKLVKKSEKIE